MRRVELQNYNPRPSVVTHGRPCYAGEANGADPAWHATWLRCLSLNKESEQRRECPNIERGRGDFVISECIKNPQPWGRCFRVGDRQIHLIAAIDSEVRHQHIEWSHDGFQTLAYRGVKGHQGV